MDNIKNKIKAIIFDMDGTIISSENIWIEITHQYLARRGHHNLDAAQKALIISFSGVGLTESATQIKRAFSLSEEVESIIAEKIELAKIMFQLKKPAFIEGFEQFAALLQTHQIPSALATNADHLTLTHLTGQLSLRRFFGEHLYSIDYIGNRAKPDPGIFLHAAEKLGVKPEECIVFEDSQAGFKAAQAAGMRCIAIKNEKNKDLLHLTHHAIETYHEAVDALREVTGTVNESVVASTSEQPSPSEVR